MQRQQLVDRLPDHPRWVETRDLLLDPEAPLVGDIRLDPFAFVVCDGDDELASVVGEPDAELIREAASNASEILAFPDNIAAVARALPDWFADEVAVHVLEGAPVSAPFAHPVRCLAPGEVSALSHLPEETSKELADVEREKPIVAAFDGERAVAFAYPASLTETLWDMSIDTIPSHRRRGFAHAAALGLIEHMATTGRAPVWCSAASNPASAALAAKLGFVAVDKIWLLTKES